MFLYVYHYILSQMNGRLVDNFSHESDVTPYKTPSRHVPKRPLSIFTIVFPVKSKEKFFSKQCMLGILLSRPSSVLPCSSCHVYSAQVFLNNYVTVYYFRVTIKVCDNQDTSPASEVAVSLRIMVTQWHIWIKTHVNENILTEQLPNYTNLFKNSNISRDHNS